MNLFKVVKSFVSDADRFLTQFDEENPRKSASQRAEIEKSQRIALLRDHVANQSEVIDK